MKKLISILSIATMGISLFAQNASEQLLKNKDNFAKTELFDSISVFANKDTNAEVLKNYELSPSSYKNNELLPIAICYMTTKDFAKAKNTLELFLIDVPNNITALKALQTISVLTKDFPNAIKYGKLAVQTGDENSIITLSKVYLMDNQIDELSTYVEKLKEMSKTNLDALNLLMVYAGKDSKNFNETLAKEVLNSADPKALLQSATAESITTVLRIFSSTNKIWPKPLIVVPARAAALNQLWSIAYKAYESVLEENPNDPIALRGMGLVAFKTGDLVTARDNILKAYKLGDKDAATDGVELFLLSRRIEIWNSFKDFLPHTNLTPQILAGLVDFSVANDGNADMFYFATLNENSQLLYKDEQVKNLIIDGVKKYESNAKAKEVAQKIKDVTQK